MADDLKPRTSENNGRLWGARAHDWADIQEGTVRPVYEAVIERTGVRSGTRYLDVGCGAGMAAQIAASHGAEVTGIDAADALLEIARSRVPEADFQQGDMEELPFADQTFDVVTGFNSFQYAGNAVVALAEARRVTKADGSVIIMTWGDPEGMEAASLVAAMRPLMPPPPPGAPGDRSRSRTKQHCGNLQPMPISNLSRFSTSTARSSMPMKPPQYTVSTPLALLLAL